MYLACKDLGWVCKQHEWSDSFIKVEIKQEIQKAELQLNMKA